MKKVLFLFLLLGCLPLTAQQRQYLWPKGQMPDAQPQQIAAMTDEADAPGFKPDKHRIPYLEWYDAPDAAADNDACMILISGGSYECCCDVGLIRYWKEELTKRGVQCVNFVYRTPRPEGLPIYQTAWEDGQRAVRLVRSEAARRGFNPEKIGVISMSAGSHLALLLATGSLTQTYQPVDARDTISCHLNWAIVNAPAYVTSDGETGTPATREGYGPDVTLSNVFPFDEKTCPISLHHGGEDPYSPNGSTLVYRQLRRMGIPAELHLYPGKGHGAFGFERGVEFMTQMGFLGPVAPEVALTDRFPEDPVPAAYCKEDIWPEGKMPDAQENQCTPYIEWYIPEHRTTDAIQIIYSGGAYVGNGPESFEVTPARRYLNALGITVVTMKYRTPRPEGLAKHTTAWQDLQRAVRIVRSEAAGRGLDPDRIGIMGSSAGGHLTLMGVTTSRHRAYLPIDDIDNISCNVQWGIGIYPAYALTDGLDGYNTTRGNDDTAVLAPEFIFDPDTAPMLLIHGDADGYAAMASVKIWEKLRAMGLQSELHTLATREHCFQFTASPGTGSYTWLDRIAEFLKPFLKSNNP
ncbi:MAG: alpha/beta hydrolase [Bacteroidales bacterium]|nr:alpha/beta hydrolase [Bacteroidales bacterium]